jgi:ABC-type polysaccharide/polyol phosphate export permease
MLERVNAAPRAGGRSGVRAAWSDLGRILGDLVEFRELLREVTLRDIRIRYKQAAMGVAWAILTPLIVVLSGWVLRLAFGRLSGEVGVEGVLAGIAVKSLAWAFFAGALSFGTGSLTANLQLVTKVAFPREVLPLAAVLTQVVDAGVGIAALVVILPFFGVGLSLGLLWVVPLLGLLVCLSTGVALLASALNVFFRDARHLVQIVVSFGIFFTPVFFDAHAFGEWSPLVMLNPLAPIVEGLRLAVIDGHNLLRPLVGAGSAVVWTPWYLLLATFWAVPGLIVSALIFHRVEPDFAEYV